MSQTVTPEDTIEHTGHLSSEFIDKREVFWVEQTKPAWGGCGDDRSATVTSVAELAAKRPELAKASEGFASIYGGLAGITKNIMITGIAQYGHAYLEKIGSFDDAMHTVFTRLSSDGSDHAIIPILHSAEGNENTDGTFCDSGDAATGCAYCGGVGATSHLLATDSLICETARQDQIHIFGDDSYVDDLLQAHETFTQQLTAGKKEAFAVDRQAYVEQMRRGVPVMILAGSHARTKDTGLICNFELGIIGNAAAANEAGLPMYREDIGPLTAAILRTMPELNLDPERLMRAFQIDSTPVRAVLAASDKDPAYAGVLDPRNLPMGFRGNPWVTIKALQ